MDEICSKCPYRVEDKCVKDLGIERIDDFVLECICNRGKSDLFLMIMQ